MNANQSTTSRARALVPLVLWAACIAAAGIWSRDSMVFDSRERAAAHYDEGTRAAMAGDLGRAVLELRRAQALHAPWWRDAEALGARIDGNLHEARRRVRATPAGADDAGGAGSAAGVRSSSATISTAESDPRAMSDVALAYVRSVPRSTRVALAAALAALACALGASRLLARGARAGSAAVPRWSPWLAAAVAVALACAAGVDRFVDARRAEAVVVRPVLPRQGPDDLTYAPAAVAPLPAGAEVRIVARTADGLWVRVAPSFASGAGGAAPAEPSGRLGWVPAAAVEQVIPALVR